MRSSACGPVSAVLTSRSPLLHFVLADLPTSTKGPELDDTHTVALLRQASDGPTSMTVDDPLMALYLAWLVAAGFLPPPGAGGKPLPTLKGIAKAVGRSGR